MDILNIILPVAIIGMLVVYAIHTLQKRAGNTTTEANHMSEGMAIGMCFGVGIGVALGKNYLTFFLPIGMLVGMIIGMNYKK